MTLDETLETLEKAYEQIWSAFHGQARSLGPRTVLLSAYASLALEHHESIALLVRQGLFGSARALAGSVSEILWHAAWANAFADETQIDDMLNDRFRFPPARDVMKALDEEYETGTLFQDIDRETWGTLKSYTRSGRVQLLACLTDIDVQPSCTEAEKIRMLTSSLTAAGMTLMLVLKAHGLGEDAAKIEQILLSIRERHS